MLAHDPSVASYEEFIPCELCHQNMPRNHPQMSSGPFLSPPEEGPSAGQVWSTRQSLMRPIVEHFPEFEKRSSYTLAAPPTLRSQAASTTTWKENHGCKENPRPCVISKNYTARQRKIYLMGTFNNGNIQHLKLLVDMFTVEVDPVDSSYSSHHLHATPCWPREKRQFIVVVPCNTPGPLPANFSGNNQGYLLGRWGESSSPDGQKYGFSNLQMMRLQRVERERDNQWRNRVDKKVKSEALREFRTWLLDSSRPTFGYESEDPSPDNTPSEIYDHNQQSTFAKSTRKSVRIQDFPSTSTSRRDSMASSTSGESAPPPRTPPQVPAALDMARVADVNDDDSSPPTANASVLSQKTPTSKSFKFPSFRKNKERGLDTKSNKSLSINAPLSTLRIAASPPPSPSKPMSRRQMRLTRRDPGRT